MKICILNGDMTTEASHFSDYLRNLSFELNKEHQVDLFALNQMNLHYCIGCWTCWIKTPGRCVHKDDAEQIFRSIINSDFFIFASPVIAGFTSSLLKKITDRLIVLIHPYFKIIYGEAHHRKRYEKYPDFGLIIQHEKDTDEEDLQIIKDIYERTAINFHSKLRFMKQIEKDKIEDIINETCNI
jgi:multimeric flavodoxin WrbA